MPSSVLAPSRTSVFWKSPAWIRAANGTSKCPESRRVEVWSVSCSFQQGECPRGAISKHFEFSRSPVDSSSLDESLRIVREELSVCYRDKRHAADSVHQGAAAGRVPLCVYYLVTCSLWAGNKNMKVVTAVLLTTPSFLEKKFWGIISILCLW